MLEHLQGKFGGNLDSFIQNFTVEHNKKTDPWDYVIEKRGLNVSRQRHQFDNKFDNISDLMERYYNDGTPAHDLAQSTAEHCATWQD